ncbi:hypothetical protein GR129_34705 (plasmid) [Streptomyces sp. HF10]|nr:hypothetical protein GR129_34705 [Streptomyces sp. HF10]
MIRLERAAEEARAQLADLTGREYEAQWRRWRKAAEAMQAAVTAHADAIAGNRYEVERAVKTAARHDRGAAGE